MRLPRHLLAGPRRLLAVLRSSPRPTLVADEWTALARYREANAALGPPRPDEARVVCFGASTIEHWRQAAPELFAPTDGWINRGISGQATPQLLLRFRQDVIELQPRVVVILAGANDIAGNTGPTPVETIAGRIASMADLARSHGIRVVLATVLPASRYGWAPAVEPREPILALNRLIREEARCHGDVMLDFHPAMVDAVGGLRADYSDDGVHPNEAGYRAMAPLTRQAVQRALDFLAASDATTCGTRKAP